MGVGLRVGVVVGGLLRVVDAGRVEGTRSVGVGVAPVQHVLAKEGKEADGDVDEQAETDEEEQEVERFGVPVDEVLEEGRHSGRGMRSGGWFCFDSAKVGFCLRRGAAAETLHGAESKAGAAALQGWDFARGGAQKARFAGGRIGLFRGERGRAAGRTGRGARGVFFG